MGVDPVTLSAVIGIGTAVAGATTSAAAAIQQNRAAKKAEGAAQRSASVQGRQTRDQAHQMRRQREREAARVRGMLRVRGAAAGAGEDSSFEDLIESVDLQEVEDLFTIDQNLTSTLARINSGLDANLADIASRRRNLVLDSLGGTITGAQSGLSIGGGIRELAQ